MKVRFYSLDNPQETQIFDINVWEEVEKGLHSGDFYNRNGEWYKCFPVSFKRPETRDDHWFPDDPNVNMWLGYYLVNEHWYAIARLIVADNLDEWQVYRLYEPEENRPPQKVGGVYGDAMFDKATGIIEIAVANGPTGSRHYIFRPGQEGWPQAYLEGWTEVRILRDKADSLLERVQRLSEEKKGLEDAIAEAVEGLNGLIGNKAMESILNPLAVLFRPNEPGVQHCGAEIKMKLEAIRAILQP